MALKINLKPHERLIIGGAVLKNGDKGASFIVENNVPILRSKDVMAERDADSLCKKIYFAIQLMYIDEKNVADHHSAYWRHVNELLKASPRALPLVEEISSLILAGKYYQSLKATRKLIEFEQELFGNKRNTDNRI